ncbi:LEA type 2 family protein [Halosimplex aquaticum]|uniref:LEA type 2 family protein n=1 Tax=Halosimplex aquaticum TaxID=3026162 RepID=A0ABD5XWS9_9EURY|nr:LEA type 2 family protein [Halosimplex aquaticum]
MISRARLRRIAAVSLGIFLVLAVGIAALAGTGVLAKPTVEGVESDWGTVTAETTEIRTTATVTNPNPVGVPGVVDVAYTARLNDVVLARGERTGVGFGPGTNELHLSTAMSNSKIAKWWVTHVNGGEKSKLRVDATVSAPGFSRDVPAQRSAVETDLLGGFAKEGGRTVEFRGEPFLRVGEQRAEWGEANESVTPLSVTSTVENVHDYPVSLDGVEYAVEMNNVTLAADRQLSGVTVEPGETGRLDVRMNLDTARMADWWANHVNDSERSTLSVELYGLVERDGEYKRVPIRIYERSLTLETDVLGGGSTSVTARDAPERDIEFERPRINDTDREWGAVDEETTEILTTVALNNTNDDAAINDLLSIRAAQHTAVNGILVATGRQRTDGLDAGRSEFELTSTMNNSKVPAWWARHVNRGEASTVTTTPEVRADLGFTRFDVPVVDQRSEFETNLLAGMGDGEAETVAVDGREAMVVRPESVRWGQATPETAPIDVNATLENEQPAPVTVTEIRYRVALNDVVLANRTAPGTHTVPPGESESIGFTMALDNQRMDEWWVTHVRRGESSNLTVAVTATVETQAGTETVRLDSLSQNSTVTTDVLGDS